MLEAQEKLRTQIKTTLDAPCANEADQRIHDRLAEFDRLFALGHTKECALQQVWNGLRCECEMIPKWVVSNQIYKRWKHSREAPHGM